MSKRVKRIKYALPFKFTDKVKLLWSYDDKLVLIHTGFPEELVEGISKLSEFVFCMDLINLPYERLKFMTEDRRDSMFNFLLEEGYRRVEFYD